MNKLKVALIGAGSRGQAYTNAMSGNDKFQVVAVAEPVENQRNYIKELHNVSEDMCFNTWEEMLELPKLADVAIISTVDSMHYAPAMKAIEKGYNLLLEKPVAPTPSECADIANYAKEKGVKILVCHVLRYTPFFAKLKEMIDGGIIGEIISIHHSECVGNVHQSHSYVRGNWHNEKESSNMLLAKSCHDIDIMQWLSGTKIKKVQSFGSLSYFTKANAPKGAPEYCIEGCPYGDECYYNAVKLYLDDKENSWFRNASTKKVNPTDEEVEKVLRETQYGKCVFKCNNDVVDHQVVNIEFENNAVASFNMCAFNEGGRFIRIMGTKGDLYGEMENHMIKHYDFKTREYTLINTSEEKLSGDITGGHGGGDKGIVNALYDYVINNAPSENLSEIGISVENHLAVFAAEKARHENKVVDVKEYQQKYLI